MADVRTIPDKHSFPFALTLAELRKLPGSYANQPIRLSYGTAPGDGLEGDFFWSNQSTTADDGYSVVAVDGVTTGRWHRVYGSSAASAKVATIAALRALQPPTTTNTAVTVLGYYTPGDGGGGEFYWDAASTTTPTLGNYFQPDAGGVGRWIRVDSTSVNAKQFGAKGDGVTDDTAAIQAALDSARRVIGRPGDVYSVSSVALQNDTHIDLNGATIKARQANANVLQNAGFAGLTANSNITVKGGKIDGNKSSVAGARGVAFYAVDGVNIDLEIYNCGKSGIFIWEKCQNVDLGKSIVHDCGDNGADSFDAANINILGGTADYPNAIRVQNVRTAGVRSYSAFAHGLIAQFTDDLEISGGEYHSNGRGFDGVTFFGNGCCGGQVYGLKVHGVSSHDNTESGMDFAAKTINFAVTGNAVYDNGVSGIFIGHSTTRNGAVSGNVAHSNGGNGIWFSDTVTNLLATGNVCRANTLNGIKTDVMSDFVITGNICEENGQYGIEVLASCSDGVVIGNFCQGNTSGQIGNGASGVVVSGNPGIKTRLDADGDTVLRLNRTTSFGVLAEFAKDGTQIGRLTHGGGGFELETQIGTQLALKNANGNVTYDDDNAASIFWGPGNDDRTNLGRSGFRWKQLFLSQFVEGAEIADPAAPDANKGRLYFRDNGAGKTQLCVRFNTGAVQVIATEP